MQAIKCVVVGDGYVHTGITAGKLVEAADSSSGATRDQRIRRPWPGPMNGYLRNALEALFRLRTLLGRERGDLVLPAKSPRPCAGLATRR